MKIDNCLETYMSINSDFLCDLASSFVFLTMDSPIGRFVITETVDTRL